MSDSEQHNDPHRIPSDRIPSDASETWDDTRITAYVMGELSADEVIAFERSLSDDPELVAAVDQATQVTDQLQSLYASETPNTLDGNRREQILAASKQPASVVDPVTVTATRSTQRLVRWVLAAAAVLLVAIGVIPKMQQAMIAQHDTNARRDGFSGQPGALSTAESSQIDSSLKMDVDLDGNAMTEDDSIDAGLVLSAEDAGIESLELQILSDPASRQDDMESSLQSIRVVATAPTPAARAIAPAAAPVELDVVDSIAAHDKRLKSADGLEAPPRVAFQMNQPTREVKIDDGVTAESLGELSKSEPFAESDAKSQPQPVSRRMSISAETESKQSGQKSKNSEVVDYRFKKQATAKGASVSGTVVLPRLYRDENLMSKLSRLQQDGDRFDPIAENEFKQVAQHPLSTFSVDVDTASYSKVRRSLVEGRLPRPDAVRIEELVNYFEYNYDAPDADSEHPFATDVTMTRCPWNPSHRLARVAIQGKRLDRQSRPPCNLVFLLDTSGSMNQPNKLPLVVEGMKMLASQLGKEDRVAIVVYAGSAGLILDSTPANKQKKIIKALSSLSANGSTAGGAGIRLAYATARDHFIKDGVNRVILCTDGDFNVGLSGTDELVRLIQEESSDGIFLTALGFGMGNHNDAMMEQISGKGNGNYAFIDTANEACKVLVRQTDATLVTIAKDVKLQIEFNPRVYSQYRLIGYENRVMAKEEFNDDKKDAGEIGAGHQVTALYELVPARQPAGNDTVVDPLKYQTTPELTEAAWGDEAMTVKLRYKLPAGETSTLFQFNAKDSEVAFDESDADFQFVASVASFGMLLRQSDFAGNWTLENVRRTAKANLAGDEFRLRDEFVQLVKAAEQIRGE